MKFKTYFEIIADEKRPKHQTAIGSRFKDTYEGFIDDDGVLGVIKKGVEDIYQTIQADKMLCDINFIVKKFTLGDTSVLERVQGIYGDFTDMPKNHHEALNAINHAQESFNKLPIEIQEAFNYDPYQFYAAVGTEKFDKAFEPFIRKDVSGNGLKEDETANERSDVNE